MRCPRDYNASMRCPYCNADDDKVIDSRSSGGGASIRRRRECQACSKRFTTYEHVEERHKLAVIKKDGARVPYDRAKILDGLEKACYKRPVSSEALTKLVDEVEEEMSRQHENDVEAIEIGRAIADRLKNIDQVAYVRYASVYRNFREASDFGEFVGTLGDGDDV